MTKPSLTLPDAQKTLDEDPVAAMYEERAEWILRSAVTVHIPDHLKRFIDERVLSGKYEDADHYIAALVKADKEIAR